MAKRFTDTDKWKRPWFRNLPVKAKIAWMYLLDQCDHCGVWIADFELMSFQCDFSVDESALKEWFGDKVIRIDEDKYVIPSFFYFQYADAKEGFRAKQSALKKLMQLGVVDENGILKEHFYESSGQSPKCPEQSGDTQGESMDTPSISIGIGIGKSIKGGVGENKPAPKLHPLAELWNAGVSNTRLPKVASFSRNGRRFKSAQARWEENSDPNFWVGVIQRVTQSRFCLGENDRKWKANFDWLIRPDSASKILEGVYDNRGSDERKSWLAEQAAKDSA